MAGKRKRKHKKDEEGAEEDLPHPSELQILIDGKPRRFTDYTREFTRRFYPNVHCDSIMVPPIVFHQNWLCTDKKKTTELQACSAGGAFKDVSVSKFSDSTSRSSVAEYAVAEVFRHLVHSLGGPNAVILGSKFENYLNKVKKKLQNVGRPTDLKDRGEHDLLFICPVRGLMVVSVKSVGSNFEELGFSQDDQKIKLQEVLEKAIGQLQLEVKVVEHVLSDLSPPVTCALALPSIPREMLASVLSGCEGLKKDYDGLLKGDTSSLCLCLEEFPPVRQGVRLSSADDSWKDRLMEWFSRRFPGADPSRPALNQQQYEDVFGRYCGLFSTVAVTHRSSEGRIEVRRLPEAVSEVSRRFRSFLLLPEQADLLSSSIPRVYLHGMTGSGKSVMLVLKARHWLNSGCDVILINVSYDGQGSPIGFRLLNDIEQSAGGEGEIGLLNVRLSNMSKTDLLKQIHTKIDEMHAAAESSTSGPATSRDRKPPVHFLLDEVYPKFQPVFEVLQEKFPDSEIWAAGLERANGPSDFQPFEMVRVLRNPPTVQKVLQLTDYVSSRRERYTVDGAKAGLPSEGPEPRFVLHQNHASSSPPTSSSSSSSKFSFMASYSPLNCKSCAEETLKIFSEIMGCAQKTEEEISATKAKTMVLLEDNAPRLRFSDVVILCKDPESCRLYLKQEDESFRLCEDLFSDYVTMVDRSMFVDTLRKGGYPVRVVTNPYSEELALSDQKAVTASWVNPASGLEWAVVLFVPGDPATESSEHVEPVLETVDGSSSHHLEPMDTSSGPASVESQTSQSKPSESRDVLPDSSQDPCTMSPDKAEGLSQSSEKPEMLSESSDNPEMHVPSGLAESHEEHERVAGSMERGLQAILTRMSERDRKYLFWGASRCTGQLIILVP